MRSAARSASGNRAAAPIPGSFTPAQLRGAYGLATASASGGGGATVAVVDAYNDPTAAADLVAYRAQFGLPACASATGVGTGPGCLTVLNQHGQASPLPGVDPSGTGGWEFEESLDLDMVSAICPNCHITLLEANTDFTTDLGTAEDAGVSLGARFVSNSWSGFDFPGESFYDTAYFRHPGVAITFASGDFGYGPGYPASSQFVTSVGGTFLTMNGDTRVSETAWNDQVGATGSGCSAGEAKPSWQTDTGCPDRTENDVSAVAGSAQGVAIFDSYHGVCSADAGWCGAAGTSVATPIIASVYALVGSPTPGTYPSSYLYRSGHAADLNDVTSGSDGSCGASSAYLCTARTGYDGPTGWGTPNGTGAFANGVTGNIVTVDNPGTQDNEVGASVHLQMQAVDPIGQAPAFSYSATGLPAGLSIGSAGLISGRPTGTGSSSVRVTARDGTRVTGSVSFTFVTVKSLLTGFHPVSGPVHLDLAGKCLDDTNNSSANGTRVQIWACNGRSSQAWKYVPDSYPGGAGVLTVHGKCVDVYHGGTANGTKVQLYTCNGSGSQQWFVMGQVGELYNPQSGKCLDDTKRSTKNGTKTEIFTCTGGTNQAWTLPASPVQSGVAGKCVDNTQNKTANGNKIQIYTCNGGNAQKWSIGLDGSLRIDGKCLDVAGRSTVAGAPVQLYSCNDNLNQLWMIAANGELENINSAECLADPGNSATNGTRLVQSPCYGTAGEIWAVS